MPGFRISVPQNAPSRLELAASLRSSTGQTVISGWIIVTNKYHSSISLVNPILGRMQQQQGLDRYKVVIDTTTTTQQDVENNTIRGKIFLQPTRSIEFISLDFVVTNAGAEI